MTLLNPYVWLVARALMAGSYLTGRFHQHKSDEKTALALTVKAEQSARKQEQEWATNLAEVYAQKASEIERVSAERDAALASLRNRPRDRLPGPPAASCLGSSPAVLSQSDAAVALGIAADADRLRVEYESCRKWIDTVTGQSQ